MTGVYDLDGISPTLPEDGDVFIAPGAAVIGDVHLASGTGIWFNAVLRGDVEPIRIGRGSNIQDGCVLHTDAGFPLSVGADCTVGHQAILHGCTLQDGVLIGMGATILNGAVIGTGSLIGAGALVTEGKVIPPRSLVMGAPGKVARELDDAAVAGILASAERYRTNMRRFRKGLSPAMRRA